MEELKNDTVNPELEYLLDPMLDYVIIGDVHGCLDELLELLQLHGYVFYGKENYVAEVGFSNNGNRLNIIFIGDIIDKGDQIAETIRFVDYLIYEGYARLLRGNHENFVYNYLKGVKPYIDLDKEFINTFLQTVGILENDDNLKEMFFGLFEDAKEFYKSRNFIATHAPCKVEYLGKIDNKSLKNQRNFRFARRREFPSEEEFVLNAEKEMVFMKEESNPIDPYHVVGHVMLPNVVRFANKLMIDTGCVAGGELTSVTITRNGALDFKSVKSKRKPTGEIFPLFTKTKD